MFDLRFLSNLKQKLTTGNRGSIYLNALPERYLSRLDLADLDFLSPDLAKSFIDALTGKPEFSISILPDDRLLEEEEKTRLTTILRRLSIITIENNDHFSEHGVQTFGFGFPILLYRDKKDPSRIVKAPMFVWSLDIKRNFKKANEWVLSRKEDYAVNNNPVLAAYLRTDAEIQLQAVYDHFLEDSLLDKEEIAYLAFKQLQQLHPNISENISQDFLKQLTSNPPRIPSKQHIENLQIQQATILWSGVFGLFKSQKESIINDLDYFIDNISTIQQQIGQSLACRQTEASALMKHNFSIVDTDPSQQHLLHLLQKGNNLVIQGPPGTGKSQSLTGIISNLLANNGTCLVVCEKKTALEVVHENLAAAGLGELAVIIEDIYRDRAEVVHSVRERAQKQYPVYQTRPAYLRVLKHCVEELERLQGFHHSQRQQLLEEKTWMPLINEYLDANALYSKEALEKQIDSSAFEYTPNEYESIIPVFDKGQELLKPLGSLEHLFKHLHPRFFENNSPSEAKLDIQKGLTGALRSVKRTQELIIQTQKDYRLQLEQHYNQLYLQKKQFVESLRHQSISLIKHCFDKQYKACKAAQQEIHQAQKDYSNSLESHFDDLYTTKIKKIDKTNTLIKHQIYSSVDGSLTIIKEAKQDIMACLYDYETQLEKHFEDLYLLKMDKVETMIETVQAGLSSSKFYFNKNKGFVRAIMRGIGSKYKQLEADKKQVLQSFAELQLIHKKGDYFSFQFLYTKEVEPFTFEDFLAHLIEYKEATDKWHLALSKTIEQEVNNLGSRTSHKAVPYKKEAQEINQGLSDFRKDILKNDLIQLEFKYESLILRDRFDQLEIIERQVQLIRDAIDKVIKENEKDWDSNSYELSPSSSDSFKDAFSELVDTHEQENYFSFDFIKIGRPKNLEDYYSILQHLSSYRIQVEEWYPSRKTIIETYKNSFKTKKLYPPLQYEKKVIALNQYLEDFVQDYNQNQLFRLPFQLEGILFEDQKNELVYLEKLLENWSTQFENFVLEINKSWAGNHPIENKNIVLEESAFSENVQQLIQIHQAHDYFDYTFDAFTSVRELLTQNFLQNLSNYNKWTEQWYRNRVQVFDTLVLNLSTEKVSPKVALADEIRVISKSIQQLPNELNEASIFLEPFHFETIILPQQEQQLNFLIKNLEHLLLSFENFEAYYNYRKYWETLNKAQQAAYLGLSKIKQANWAAVFTSWYFYALLQHHHDKFPDEENYQTHKNLFLEHTKEFKKLLVSQSLRYWRSKQTLAIQKFHTEKAPIKLHSLYNKRGHLGGRRTPLRKIIATSTDLFTSFFPVLLVSPSVCSSILPLEANLFDAVIFDEASQLRLEDTFCALVRGKYKVVSGDSQQMPPSDYFQSNMVLLHEEDDLEEDTENSALVKESIDFLTSAESLLDYALAEGSYKESFLEVHYRSKHPYLIDFSNAAFYGNRLTPMPSSKEYIPIEFHEVNGLYDQYTNKEEARQLIDYIIEFARPFRGKSCPSVGIATFNMHQRNLILELIEQRAVEGNKDSTQLQKLFLSGLFVKNLENIQGDERDLLIISTTFGSKEDGSFIQNFGPINRKKGYRLLNVIITRAKQKLTIFTSIPAKYYESYRQEITKKGNNGKGIFYAYLAYAKAVYQKDEQTRKAILQLLYENCLKKPLVDTLYESQDNAFKERVASFLEEQFPNRVLINYQHAGFKIPLVVTNKEGIPTWAFDFDTYHEQTSEEAYAWDLFREQHLSYFGFKYHRVWSKDWLNNKEKAAQKLIETITQ